MEVQQPTAATKADYMQRLRDLGVEQYVGIQPTTSQTLGDWDAYFYPVSTGAGCLHGTDYISSVRPSTTGSDDVVFFLQGGGGCWNELTCHGVEFAKREADVPRNRFSGLFDWTDDRNPVQDWNIVFASYCDGSVFSGDNIVDYGGKQTWHWGLRNLSAAVTLMKEYFPNPGKILVTGSSAGGFGTFMGFGAVRLAYPDHFIYHHNDSGPGFENPRLADSMSADIRRNWQFEQFIPEECTACEEQLTALIPYALAHDPDMVSSMFSYLDDGVIGYLFVQFFTEYTEVLRQTTGEIHRAYPDRFRRFFVDGLDHTILSSDLYYRTWPNDHMFADWLGGFLEGDTERWVDLP